MLKTVEVTNTVSVNQLIKLWAVRYLPDLSILPSQKGQFPTAQMVESASEVERAKTVDKVKRFLQLNCQLAGLEANSLFSYVPNIVDLAEARRLAQSVEQVYSKMLEVYLRQQPPSRFLKFIDSSSELFSRLAMPALMLPTINLLADELEPILLQLQQQHFSASDPRTIGFITTQFHFSTREVLKQLTPCEQVLLTPYLKFVEEQVCIPWQRICAAASRYLTGSPTFALVEQLLTVSHEIAETVYHRSTQLYPNHCSRRGNLSNPGVAASTIRDLTMFQAYLFLCILEADMAAIEQELLPLCKAVFPSIEVKWALVEQMINLLTNEIEAKVSPEQRKRLRPYTQAMQKIFMIPVDELGSQRLAIDNAPLNLIAQSKLKLQDAETMRDSF